MECPGVHQSDIPGGSSQLFDADVNAIHAFPCHNKAMNTIQLVAGLRPQRTKPRMGCRENSAYSS
jgi:hypothetical protein